MKTITTATASLPDSVQKPDSNMSWFTSSQMNGDHRNVTSNTERKIIMRPIKSISPFGKLTFVAVFTAGFAVQSSARAGTLFVNANDPGCSPTGPVYCEIQDAVNAAAEGDNILVAAGTYAPIVIDTDNLTIQAVGGNEVIVDGTGVLDSVTINANGVTIRGLTAVNGHHVGFNIYGNANRLLNNKANGSGSNGFQILGNSNFLNANISTENNNGFAIVGGKSNTLHGNLAEGNNLQGFKVTKQFQFIIPTFPSVFATDNVLEGNIARDNGRSGFDLEFGSSLNLLRGNRSEGNGTALNLGDDSGFLVIREADGNILQGNIAEGNTGEGFALANCSFNTLQANSAKNNGDVGFFLVDIFIPSPAPFLDPYWDLISQDGPTESNTFRANMAMNNNSDGFRITDTDLSNNDANVFESNTSLKNTGWGYFVDPVLSNVFENNNCQLNGLGGANVAGICH